MSFITRIFGNKESNNPLLGNWVSDLNDQKTRNTIGNVTMIFTNDGKLSYAIREGDKNQIINMIYSIDGNILVTDQPSHPQVERTEYTFIDENILILKFNGEESRFLKST